MNILVFGATGRVGSQIVTYALHDGHHVTVLVRTPEKMQIYNEQLTIIQGNVLNKDDLVRAMHGTDVVISALNTDGTTTLSESMPLIIEAMENEGIKLKFDTNPYQKTCNNWYYRFFGVCITLHF